MSKRILVVEDQEDLRGILRDLLTGSGYTAIEAEDREAGVAKERTAGPYMWGQQEACRQLR